jgi:hypothetical protein
MRKHLDFDPTAVFRTTPLVGNWTNQTQRPGAEPVHRSGRER